MSEFIKDLIKDVIIALILAGIILFFIRPTIVEQTSMQNTFQPHDYLIMSRQAYRSNEPQRGDVIVFQSELDGGKLLIKRVIGLPGDVIQIGDGDVTINGEAYEEDYTKDGYTTGTGTWTVPEDSYFCMGDNRVVSIDSRSTEVGYVSRDSIKGKVVLRLFPFNKIQRFK